VVAYGGDHELAACLDALDGVDVLVVDNLGSSGAERLCHRDRTSYVRSPHNLGFAGGVNVAMLRAPGRDLVLVNPDAVVSGEGVRRLAAALHKDRRTAAAAPVLRYPDGSPQRTWWPVPSPSVAWADVVGLAERAARDWFLAGSVLALRADAIADIGPFDEQFFLYAEETDWQLRALRRGWRLVQVDDVAADHVGGAMSADPEARARQAARSARQFARKWYSPAGAASMRVAGIAAAMRRAVTATGGGWPVQRETLRVLLGRA
jgi:GT2 family glycosyltransferase